MKIASHHADGVARLSLDGDLDMSTTPHLVEQVSTALRTTEPRALLIDATELAFCDSSGIQALVNAYAEATRRGMSFQLLNVQGIARRTLQLTGVLEILTGTPATGQENG